MKSSSPKSESVVPGDSPKSKESINGTKKSSSSKQADYGSRTPSFLMPLVQLDRKWTRKLALCASTDSTLAGLRPHMKALEWSAHGVPWLATCLALLFFCRGAWEQQVSLNLLLALVLDVIFVSIIKSVFRRRRPEHNRDDMRATPGFVDIYAFPSGHASRAVMVAMLLVGRRFDVGWNIILGVLLGGWAIFVSCSRILLGRHHIGDVLVGVLLGYMEHALVDWIWLGPEAARSFLWFLDADISEDT